MTPDPTAVDARAQLRKRLTMTSPDQATTGQPIDTPTAPAPFAPASPTIPTGNDALPPQAIPNPGAVPAPAGGGFQVPTQPTRPLPAPIDTGPKVTTLGANANTSDGNAPPPATTPPTTTPPATTPPSSGYPSGGGTTDRASAIAQIFRTATGRDARPDELAAYVNGSQDLAAIQQAIYNSDEAKAYSTKQTAGATTSTPAGGGTWQDWVKQAYQQTRGRDPNPAELADWERYWNDWGSKDPAYFKDRLFNPQNYGGGADGRSGSGSAPGTSPDTAAYLAQLRAFLMARLAAAGTPVDPNAPEIAAPVQAARLEAARSGQQERSALAERLYATGGLNTNELNQGIQASAERTAVGLGTLRGQLISQEYTQKKQEMQSYLQMALAAGDAQSAREIQLYLAQLDDDFRKAQLKYQANRDATTAARG